jgi:flagellar hook-length control protein FliK
VDLVVSPTTVALNPQQGAAVPALKAGDIIEAQVLQLLGDGAAKLSIGNTVIDVQTQVALTPGTSVRLAVKNTPDGIRLTLLGNAASTPATSAPPAAAATVAAETTNAATAASVATSGSGSAAVGTPTTAAAATTAANPQLAPSPQSPVAVTAAALAAAVQISAARQSGLSPLFADAGIAAAVPALPEPVRQAAERMLALQPTLDETVSAEGIKQALGSSGLFLEARLSAAANGDAVPAGAANDLKAALVVLRNVLGTWLASDGPEAAMLKTGTGPQDIPAAPSIVPDSAGHAEPRAPAATSPPPPYRGAPTAAQPAAAPSISPDMAPRDIGKVLLSETDAAIARQTLLQAASLPDHLTAAATTAARSDTSGPRWNFEVPFATPQGTAVAQFEIARDGRNVPAEGAKPAWRARFSLDVEPIGPVHAQIALTGARAAVTLWAERPATSAQLRDNAPKLADALRQAELEPGDVLVRAGVPPRPREGVASGHFLDRSS